MRANAPQLLGGGGGGGMGAAGIDWCINADVFIVGLCLGNLGVQS